MSSRVCAATQLNLEDIMLLDESIIERLTLHESTYMRYLKVTFLDSKSEYPLQYQQIKKTLHSMFKLSLFCA